MDFFIFEGGGGYVGWLRNWRVTADMLQGTTINDEGGTPIGYALCYSTTFASDTFAIRSGAG